MTYPSGTSENRAISTARRDTAETPKGGRGRLPRPAVVVLTFEGVGLSVPAIYFFAVFKNRVSTISAHTILKVDELLRRIHSAIRGKTPAGPTATA